MTTSPVRWWKAQGPTRTVCSVCAARIAGGMGRGAYDHATGAGIDPIVTSLIDIDEAAIECAAGSLVDEVERLR